MSSVENTRIAKNTAFLYIRMLLLFVVNFYTTRVLLRELGVEDFGLYNVVAGFVTMLGFMNQSMTNSIQRFMNYQMGLKEKGIVKLYFEVSLSVQLLIGLLILVLLESAGVWFLNSKMTIPPERITEANIIYQLSCLSLLISVIRTPYNAVVIAKEKMNFYAYMSIIEAIIKLTVAFLIGVVPIFKLSFYSGWLFVLSLLFLIISMIYVRRIEPLLKLRLSWNTTVFKEIFSFSGWNLFGTASGMAKSQGINVLMNVFFDVTINAARGVAFQVLGGVQQFVANFQSAINPQIVQSYANDNRERYLFLTYASAKISIFLMWLITLPVIICIDEVLVLWLGEGMVPPFTNEFVIIILLTGLFDSLGSSLSTSIYATGNIKTYQIVVSTIKVLVIPIAFVLYKIGFAPASSMYVSLCFSAIEQFFRVRIWSNIVKENPMVYLKTIVIPSLIVILSSFFFTYLITELLDIKSRGLALFIKGSFSVIIGLLFIVFAGLNRYERSNIYNILKLKVNIHKINK